MQLVGTKTLLSSITANLIRGFVVRTTPRNHSSASLLWPQIISPTLGLKDAINL
jgi:molybdopterin biosynthesis enzyme MoaB